MLDRNRVASLEEFITIKFKCEPTQQMIKALCRMAYLAPYTSNNYRHTKSLAQTNALAVLYGGMFQLRQCQF